MTSATDPARVEPLEFERVTDRRTAETPDAGIAFDGGEQPPEIGTCDPRSEFDAPADGEGAK